MIKKVHTAWIVVPVLLVASACTSGTNPSGAGPSGSVESPAVVSTPSTTAAPNSANSGPGADESTGGNRATQTNPSPSTTATSLQVSAVNQIEAGGALATTSSEGPTIPPAAAAGDGNARCSNATIGVLIGGAQQDEWLSQNISAAVKTAVQEHNEQNKHCQVAIRTSEYQSGDVAATSAAKKLVEDKSVVAVIGPESPSTLKALAPVLNSEQIPVLPLGIIGIDGKNSVFAGNATSAVLAKYAARYLISTENLYKVCVVNDGSSAAQTLATGVSRELNGSLDKTCTGNLTNINGTVSTMHSEAPDGIFYAGGTQTLATFVTALRKAGVSAGIYTGPVDSTTLIKKIGSLAAGITVVCPCASTPSTLSAKFKDASVPFGQFSTEAYDLATVLLHGIDAGVDNGADMDQYLRKYDGQGYGGDYRWSKNGLISNPRVWLYQIGV